MKGNIVVALGLIFWLLGIRAALLWAVLMAPSRCCPRSAPRWCGCRVAMYLLASGSVWKGVVLIAYGVVVIGLVDNVLHPTARFMAAWDIFAASRGGRWRRAGGDAGIASASAPSPTRDC